MQAQQLIHSANLDIQERRIVAKQNQARLSVDQAEICANSCILIDTFKPEALEKTQPSGTLFSAQEEECIDICQQKLYGTTKVLRGYIPFRMRSSPGFSEKELERRLNNPTDRYGPYFTHDKA